MRARGFAIGLIVVLAMAGCSKSSSTHSGGSTTAAPATTSAGGNASTITVGGQTANNHGTVDVTGKSSTDIEARDFYFSPTVLHGTPSQKITLIISNNTQTLHNFSDDTLNINKDIPPGGVVNIKVKFGNVLDAISVFYCKYHQSSGMRGAIQVPR